MAHGPSPLPCFPNKNNSTLGLKVKRVTEASEEKCLSVHVGIRMRFLGSGKDRKKKCDITGESLDETLFLSHYWPLALWHFS